MDEIDKASAALRSARAEPLRRTFALERAAVDTATRTVQLAFSSETPVERGWGLEILDHAPESVDLTRLNNGGALLLNHDVETQIGVVDRAMVSPDKICRAVVRFSRSAAGEEILQDVADGIRTLVSVGYMINEMRLDSTADNVDSYRVTSWTPLEVSIVSVPADATVGVGRALTQEANMPEVKEVIAAPAAPVADVQTITAQARDAEVARIRELTAIGAQFDERELAQQYVDAGRSADEMRKAVLERVRTKAEVAGKAADVGLTEREVKQFSFLRVLNALANPTDRKAQEAAAYEREVSDAAAKVSGKSARGFLVPGDVLRAPLGRDLTVGSPTGGGDLVSTNLLAGSFVDMLRNVMITQRAGATMLRGLSGNVAIPRQTGGATAYWVAESGAPTESAQAVDQVTLSPKTVGAFTDISRRLLLQSSIDVEAFVRRDITTVLGLAIDTAALYGTGTSQPTGVKLQTGINTVDFNAAAPTYAEVVAMETEVASDNADMGTLAYIVSAAGRGALKGAEKSSGSGQFVWEPGDTVNGYRALVSNQLASGDYWFGNWADLLIGMWSGLDIMADPYQGATSGTVRIVALQDVDVAVRHGESFCRGNNTL